MSQDYEDVLEQALHDLRICKQRDDVHEADDSSNMKLSDKIRKSLDDYGYAVLEKYGDD